MKKIISLAIALILVFSAAAFAESIPVIGISQYGEHGSLDNCREGFLQGLAEAGLVEGTDFTVIYQNAGFDNATATQIAQGFSAQNVAIMCAIATPSATACYSAAEDSWAPDIQTLPDFREGDRYILCLALPKTEQYAWRDYPNAIFLLGNGEVYYVTEGDLIMPTQSFREEYAGYARKTFKRLLRELYEEAVSRQEDKNGSVRGEMA